MEFFEEFSSAFGSRKKLADNKERPLVADQLQRAGDWAAIDFASSHSADYSLSRQSLSQCSRFSAMNSATQVDVVVSFFRKDFPPQKHRDLTEAIKSCVRKTQFLEIAEALQHNALAVHARRLLNNCTFRANIRT
jgi:hypothetical protein